MDTRVYLLGFMGAGKTTVGRDLSRRLDWPLVDLDEEIERFADRPIPEIFRTMGEDSFRQMELRLLDRVSRRDPPLIVACGGGLPMEPRNRRIMRETGLPVLLQVRPETALERIGEDPNRPLFARGPDALEKVRDLWERRRDDYLRIRNRVDTDDLSPGEVSERVRELIRQHGPPDS